VAAPEVVARFASYGSTMDGLAVKTIDQRESAFALALEYLHPVSELTAEVISRDMVSLITALEGHVGTRVVMQLVSRPEPKSPERGVLEVHILGIVLPRNDDMSTLLGVRELADDLDDLLAMPPLRWSFRRVVELDELDRVLKPLDANYFAEIARREESPFPIEWSAPIGFLADPTRPFADRRLWSMWTLGPPSSDLRRVASVLLAQSAPVALRIVLTPATLATEERAAIEELTREVSDLMPTDGLLRASLHTIQSLLYLRPLFEMQCIVASPDPLSRSLLSSIGHAVSVPAPHGVPSPVLQSGFAVLREGVDTEPGTLSVAFAEMRCVIGGSSHAPESLRRLRRLVGSWEAANVFRLPIADHDVFPGLESFDLPQLSVPVSDLAIEGTRLGRPVGRSDSPVVIEAEERFRHMYVVGQTGTGKSTLLFNLALQDIEAGNGVAVLDPHGDLVESLLDCIPEERLDDVVLIDPADPVAVVGVNLLEAESDVQRQYLIAELCGMFQALFDPFRQGIVGPRYETMLRGAAGLLLAHPEQPSSMLDITTVFSDQAVREYLLAGITDPILSEYWQGEVAQNRSNDYGEVISWFRSKFEVFRTSSLVRNVVGQAKSTISFGDVLNNRRILLVNLSKGMLGEYNSALLGQVVFMRLWGAALERASLPMEQRQDFFIYVDEFQNMTTDSLPSVLSEARKFRVGLTLANQFFTQVPEGTRDSIMGNVGSRVTFRLGPKDAQPFAFWLGSGVRADDLTELPNFHSVVSLSQRGVPLDSFVMRSDPPRNAGTGTRGQRARERSRANWARPIGELDVDFFGRWAGVHGSFAERARRSSKPTRAGVKAPSGTRNSFLDDWLAKREAANKSPEPQSEIKGVEPDEDPDVDDDK